MRLSSRRFPLYCLVAMCFPFAFVHLILPVLSALVSSEYTRERTFATCGSILSNRCSWRAIAKSSHSFYYLNLPLVKVRVKND